MAPASIRIPSATADRPRAWSVAAVAVIGLITGLGLARWAAADVVVVDDEDAFASPGDEGVVEGAGEVEVEGAVEVEGEGEGEGEGEVVEGEVVEGEVAERDAAAVEVAEVEVAPPVEARPALPVSTGPISIRRGRVAVLRCDGAPQQTGPFPCPRDEALELAVWAAIDTLPVCAAPPPPGAADLVIDFDRTIGPAAVLRARDTFRDDVTRSNGEAIVTCLAPALTTLASPIPGERLMFSFRFVVE